MATANNSTTKFSGANSEIKLSEIRNFFGGNTNNVRFGKYYRKTSTSIPTGSFQSGSTTQSSSSSDPNYVPNATENSTIPSSQSNMAFSDFRGNGNNGVIKEYSVLQTGSDEELSMATDIAWNSNLDKNVPKRVIIQGRVFSNDGPTTWDGSGYDHGNGAALRLSAEAYNLRIEVDTATNSTINSNNAAGIFGAAGLGGSPNTQAEAGGTAVYLKQNSNVSVNTNEGNSTDIILDASSGRVYAGGGGGQGGRDGNSASTAQCRFKRVTNTETVTNSGFTIRSARFACYNSASAKCGENKTVTFNNFQGNQNVQAQNFPNQLFDLTGTAVDHKLGWGNSMCNGSGGRCRCRGGGRGRGCDASSGCYNNITKICRYEFTFNGNSGQGGQGGQGGNGAGHGANTPNNGQNGTNGSTSTCNTVWYGNTGVGQIETIGGGTGNDGEQGAAGGAFGQAGGNSTNRANSTDKGGKAGHAIYSNTKSKVKYIGNTNIKGLLNNATAF